MPLAAWIGPAIVAAFISSLVTVLGWWVSGQQERRRERIRREERIIDVQTALRAEIRSHRNRLALFHTDAPEPVDFERFSPFIPHEVGNPVFDAVIDEIQVLPTAVIDPVVLYYRQATSLARLAEDMNGAAFERLPGARKFDVYRDYLAIGEYARVLAEQAIAALEDRGSVNSSGGGRSDPEWAGPGAGFAAGAKP